MPSTSNAAAVSVPISKEESALLADERCIQQETDNLECLLAMKCKQREELAKKWKEVQTKHEEEMKVRARMLTEAAMAEVRWAAKHANERTKDVVRKAMEELQRLQSPAKGKQWLVSTSFLGVVTVLRISISQCHAGEGEGLAGGCEERRVEAEGE